MTQTLSLRDIYCADLFSRAKAAELASHISTDADSVVLDFTGITFMSRSFADELYNVIAAQAPRTFDFAGRSHDIDSLMQKVADGRTRERQLGIQHPQMLTFDTKENLSKFLVAQ